MREYTRELVSFLHALQPSDLPAEVIDRARYFLLDYLACAIRGSREESSAAVQRMIQRLGANGCATVIGTRIRTIPGLAAMANGAAAHGIEQDDTHSGGSIHLGATMYSAALALAETMPETSSETFLGAVVAGFEAAARIAMAVQPKEHYALGFHMTPTCGVFGAAITSAKLLGLTWSKRTPPWGLREAWRRGQWNFWRMARGPSESTLA
jgi:2-methylcitrate dehydratase PrpD